MDDYDVFLNHRGPDVKGSFVAHLDDALRGAGLNPFLDKRSLVKGRPAFSSIDAALAVAKVHVAVVSRGYAESKHCLSELVAMLRSGKPVIPVFYDVEAAELRRVDSGVFAAAFEKHRTRETGERVKEWANALCKLADITAFVFRLSDYRGDEAVLKHEVVDAILSLFPLHVAMQVERHLIGLGEAMKICINKVKKMSSDIGLLCLGGVGGIGKTSLAKVIYNHFVDERTFQATSFLEIGRSTSTSLEVGSSLLTRLQKQLLWDLLRIPEGSQWQKYEHWYHKLSSIGPVLIVLDDIADKEQFDKLMCGTSYLAPGSCIIVTSRDQHLLKLIGGKSNFYLHEVRPLGCEDSHKLFNLHAFGDEEAPKNLKDLAKDVSNECGGLPLALKVVGSSLFGKTSDEDEKYIWPEAIEALKGNQDIKNALKWSYDCLSESEKLMFVDIACVFCGWMKQEVMEIWQSCKKCSSCCGNGTPHTSLSRLIEKSLVFIEECNPCDVLAMHGLVQNMGQSIGEVDGSHLWENKAMKMVEEKTQVESTKVRAMSFANTRSKSLNVEDFAKMPNLHFLILDGCDVHGNLGSISKELRYIRWRHMPLSYVPSMLNLSNLVSLDFSESTKLASTWIESETALEGCPNLLKLDLSKCTSITMLPESIGRLSKLQELNLTWCTNLRELPHSIGKLTTLEMLYVGWCGSLEALPDSITALSRLQRLYLFGCTSLSKLPASIGLMTSLMVLSIPLAIEGQALGIEHLNALEYLHVTGCSDKAITAIDGSSTLTNLHRLSNLYFLNCSTMTKLPESIGLFMNLEELFLWHCEKLQELPNSVGQLKLLRHLELRYCDNMETLPDSLGALTKLESLGIVNCASITRLPSSIGHLSRLEELSIDGCSALKSFPDSLNKLNKLHILQIMECGSSLEGLGLLRALQGLHIWGCTSITQLPGSCLVVVDSDFHSTNSIWNGEDLFWTQQNVREVQVVEENDCGLLRHVREEKESGRAILQRVHNSCCKLGLDVHSMSCRDAISLGDQTQLANDSRSGRLGEEETRYSVLKEESMIASSTLLVTKDLPNKSSTGQQSWKLGQTLQQIVFHITSMFTSSTSSRANSLDTRPKQSSGHNLCIEEII